MATLDDPRVSRGMETLLAVWRKRVAAGERPIGWKMGYGAAAARERLGIKSPLSGYLTDGTQVPSGAKVSVTGWGKALVEPEIAVYFGRDLAVGADSRAVRAAISAVGPAFELVDLGNPTTDVEAILGRNISHKNVVLGPRDESRSGGNLEGLSGRVFRNGVAEVLCSDPQAANGDLIENVREMAEALACFGETLHAGQVIITGSIVPPLPVAEGDEVIFHLDPIGSVAVRF
jgi:2-keto-4-pentenoate hydratase